MDLKGYSPPELLHLYDELLNELLTQKIIRTHNNPVADYAEWLVANALSLNLCPNSNKSCDAISKDGIRYQIKARRFSKSKGSRQLSAIRDLDGNGFHFLIAVLFDCNFSVIEAYQIPHNQIAQHARFSEHTNAHLLQLKGPILTAPGVVRIDDQLRYFLGRDATDI